MTFALHAKGPQFKPGMKYFCGEYRLSSVSVGPYAGVSQLLQDVIRDSIGVSISACHAEDPGSIPGRGVFLCVPGRQSCAQVRQIRRCATWVARGNKSAMA